MNTSSLRAIRSEQPNSGHEAVKTGLASQFDRLWRFGLVLLGSRAAAEDLVRIASTFGRSGEIDCDR